MKITNKMPQPIMLSDGTVILSYDSVIVDEDRISAQVLNLEKKGLIKIKKAVFSKAQR